MQCPYCNEEMTRGLLMPSRDGAVSYWLTEAYEKQHPFPPYTRHDLQEAGALKLYTGFGLHHTADPFWLCRSCGKLIGKSGFRKQNRPSRGE